MDIDNVPVLRLCQLFLLYECISLTVEKGCLYVVFISPLFAKHNSRELSISLTTKTEKENKLIKSNQGVKLTSYKVTILNCIDVKGIIINKSLLCGSS